MLKQCICITLLLFVVCCGTILAAPQLRLKIGTRRWRPYHYYEGDYGNQFINGFGTEVVTAVLERLNIQIEEFAVYPRRRALKWLFEGEIDAFYSENVTKEYQRFCYLPDEPLFTSSWVFFIRKKDADRLSFQSFDDLRGKQIGVVQDYPYTPEFWDFLKQQGTYQIVVYDEQNFQKLVRDRIDYVVAELENGLALLDKLELNEEVLPLTATPLATRGFHILFSKKTVPAEFVEQFSAALQTFKSTPEYQALWQQYFPE